MPKHFQAEPAENFTEKMKKFQLGMSKIHSQPAITNKYTQVAEKDMADIPHAEPMRSAYLTLVLETPEEAEHIYSLLSSEGEVFMKMERKLTTT